MSKKEAEKTLAKLIDKVENGGFKNAGNESGRLA